jgi:hypothetical protein
MVRIGLTRSRCGLTKPRLKRTVVNLMLIIRPDQMADSGETQENSVGPWTIKGIRDEVRNAVIAAAERDNQPLGEWASRAFRAKI